VAGYGWLNFLVVYSPALVVYELVNGGYIAVGAAVPS
jgi:hypothetical protein